VLEIAEKLGILVCTDKYLDHVVGLTKAARAKGKEVQIFFTANAVFLTQDPEFSELLEAGAKVSLCDKTYKGFDLHETYKEKIEGVEHTNQEANAAMAEEVDKYVVF
jgi:peroxiredoxin family protein